MTTSPEQSSQAGRAAPHDPSRRNDDAVVRALMESIRQDIQAPASLRIDVMREVHAVRMPAWRRLTDWLLRPRTVQMSPAGGLALAGAMVLLLYFGVGVPGFGLPGNGTGGEPSVVQAGDRPAQTRFVFIAPEATSVGLTGDFADWDPSGIQLRDERGTGVWTVDVPLEPGVYQYAFIVDGREWRPDPRAVSRVDDGFGRENSVIIVSEVSEL